MKACVLHESRPVTERPLAIDEVDPPALGPGQVRVKVSACGVCRTDLHVVEGELDQSKQKRPVIPGHQVVGRVDQVGAGGAGTRPRRPRRRGMAARSLRRVPVLHLRA